MRRITGSLCRNVSIVLGLAHLVTFSTAASGLNSAFLLSRIKRQSTCKEFEFKCGNGQCISSYNVCDGSKDCADSSDEQKSTCSAMNISCPSLSFQCSYGACVDKGLRCDGKSDCADDSDERDCAGPTTNCMSGSFMCSGGECVNQYAVCDGAKDCSDGSDETAALCRHLTCPQGSFQCDYGACVEKSVQCDGALDCADGSDEKTCTSGKPDDVTNSSLAGGCRLPPHPRHGVYVSSQCEPGDSRLACRNTPGTPVQNTWLLKYSCNTNYELSAPYEYSVCERGVWKNTLDCIKLCPALRSLSVDVRCELEGREVPCDRPTKPGTTASARCKQHYQLTYRPEYSRLTCLPGGEWSYPLFYCTPVCGLSLPPGTLTTLILNGSKTKRGEFPWLVALYLRMTADGTADVTASSPWTQQCGGTLITPHIVLTAAHCVVFLEGTLKPEEVKVGLGKYQRDFYTNENFSVIANVREIVIPPYYSGESTYFALDIALLDLTASVQVTTHIMPACVDWGSTPAAFPDNIGHVAGWGTTDGGKSSEVVLSTRLPYIDNSVCVRTVRAAFKRLVTHDKFCVQSVNGSQVDKGDSGGGMTAVRNGQHFVIGIVSTKLRGDITFSLFTNISNAEHSSWLDQQRTRLDSLHRET